MNQTPNPFQQKQYPMEDLRERLTRTEQNHVNLKENFLEFKRETQEEFHSLNMKLDMLLDEISGIKTTIARWLGAGGVVIFVGEYVIQFFMKAH